MSVDIDRLVTAWIDLTRAEKNSPDYEKLFWAHGKFWDLCLESPQEAWSAVLAVLAVLARKPDARVLTNLAAGPMEDLLVHHGPAVIEQVEERAETDAAFAALLGGVWKNDIDDDIWKRVVTARSHVW